MTEEVQIFTLKQVVSSIKKTIEDRYSRLYWVKAEMHKLNLFPSGHCFPELLQKEEGKVVAEMRGVIWKSQYEKINAKFVRIAKEPLKEDSTLLMQVRISFHETYGLSLQIIDIDPNYTLGELQRERQETLKKLQKSGLINKNQQLKFPLLPKRIAVISADASKGLSDFYKVIENNDWGYKFFTMLFPAYLQGDVAVNSIREQLRHINKVRGHFDVVVIVRGGGGEVGLSCYNNHELCKDIAQFPLPILTGIGHSTNLTVAEMIAYRNAITPTELGDFLIQAFHNFSVPLKESIDRIRIFSKQTLSESSKDLEQVIKDLVYRTRSCQSDTKKDLHNLSRSLKTNTDLYLRSNRERLRTAELKSSSSAKLIIAEQKHTLRSLSKDLPKIITGQIESNRNQLEKVAQSVRLMDPINVLKRGYSITTLNGRSISYENDVKIGDEVMTLTADLELKSIVKEKEKRKN